MKKGDRLKEALISIAIGVTISLLTALIEVLKEVDIGTVNEAGSSAAGMVAYILQRVRDRL